MLVSVTAGLIGSPAGASALTAYRSALNLVTRHPRSWDSRSPPCSHSLPAVQGGLTVPVYQTARYAIQSEGVDTVKAAIAEFVD